MTRGHLGESAPLCVCFLEDETEWQLTLTRFEKD